MELKAYAKVNLILNVLGTLPSGYHEVCTLMQAIDLCDVVRVGLCGGEGAFGGKAGQPCMLRPEDFEYGKGDLAWKAALLMCEELRPQLVERDAAGEVSGLLGISVSIEKHIPAAAGLAGGSSDAAAVMVGLAKLWGLGGAKAAGSAEPKCTSAAGSAEPKNAETPENSALLETLLPLGARLGSDVPFCIAAQLGRRAAIATGTGTTLEFVRPTDCKVELFFSEKTLENKTRAVYAELREQDCSPVRDVRAFLSAKTIAEKRALMGNHLQAPAERLMQKAYGADWKAGIPQDAMLCGAGPTYFRISER